MNEHAQDETIIFYIVRICQWCCWHKTKSQMLNTEYTFECNLLFIYIGMVAIRLYADFIFQFNLLLN